MALLTGSGWSRRGSARRTSTVRVTWRAPSCATRWANSASPSRTWTSSCATPIRTETACSPCTSGSTASSRCTTDPRALPRCARDSPKRCLTSAFSQAGFKRKSNSIWESTCRSSCYHKRNTRLFIFANICKMCLFRLSLLHVSCSRDQLFVFPRTVTHVAATVQIN